MRHGFKKYKFSHGHDSDRMLVRKLLKNFLVSGKVETTVTKLKALRPIIEKTVTRIKGASEADNKKLLEQMGEIESLKSVFESIRESLEKYNSGFVRIIKMGMRPSDGAIIARLEWAHPVVSKNKAIKVKSEPKLNKVAKKEEAKK